MAQQHQENTKTPLFQVTFKLLFYKVCRDKKKWKLVLLGVVAGICALNCFELFQETSPTCWTLKLESAVIASLI